MTPFLRYPLLLALAGLLVGPCADRAAADGPTGAWRARLAPPPGGRITPDWAARTAEELSAELGVAVRPVIRGSQASRLAARTAGTSATPGRTLEELMRWVRVEPGTPDPSVVLERLETDPRVDRLEAVPLARTCAIEVDDPLVESQRPWLEQIGMFEAWAAADEPTSPPVLIGIVDGGTDFGHPDLLANVAVNGGEIPDNGIDDDGNGFVDDVYGWNFPAEHPDPGGLPDQPFNSRHGTHVAGTAGAVLGNGIGTAGTGTNPGLILVNAAHPEIDGGIAYGYEGILYALGRGARVINCSWRTARFIDGRLYDAPWFEFEALVLQMAREAGALVVAATGNDGETGLWTTPAGYEDAMAVAATDFLAPEPWVLSNRAPWIELFAPGQYIISTYPRSQPTTLGPYGVLTGTSMATAVTAGVAAFVARQRPEWSPEQLRSRLRWTGQLVEALGGQQLLRADRAAAELSGPDVALSVRGANDADGNGLPEGDEIFDLRFDARARFASQAGVRVFAETDDPWIVPLITAMALPRVPADRTLAVQRGLRFWVHPSTPPGHVARIQIRAISDGAIGPLQSGAIVVRPLTATVANEVLRASASANGLLGEAILYPAQDPVDPALIRTGDALAHLRRAALVLAGSDGRVSHAMLPRAPGVARQDFVPLQGGLERNVGPEGDQEIRLAYSDRPSAGSLGVNVSQRVLLASREGEADFVLLEYEVEALDEALDGVRFALALDWSMPGAEPFEYPGYVEERLVPIVDGMRVEAAEPGRGATVAGARILDRPSRAGWSAIALWQSDEEPGWNVIGAPSATIADSALFARVQPGEGPGLELTGDRVGLLSADLGRFAIGERRRAVVAMAVATSPAELDEILERARIAWEMAQLGLSPETAVSGIVRFSPNPFRTGTEMSFVVARAGAVRAEVFDVRGRRVRRLVDGPRVAGVHRIRWDGRDDRGAEVASGVYLLRLRTPSGTSAEAITRVR